jgi:hypothetical protein
MTESNPVEGNGVFGSWVSRNPEALGTAKMGLYFSVFE